MFEWFDGNLYQLNATFYENNITLNTLALEYFKQADYCVLGLSVKENKVAIKASSLEDVELKRVKAEQLNKISKGKSYIRISNKAFIEQIHRLSGVPIIGNKFKAQYDEVERVLIIDLNDKIQG